MSAAWDAIVVGSGAAGAVTAATLARAGARVLVLEEGTASGQPGNAERFTLSGMSRLYRNGGQRVAIGSPLIGFGEGFGAGGSTEVNSGLYHRPPDALLEKWAAQFDIREFGAGALDAQLARIEKRLQITTDPAGPAPGGLLLQEGARALGWQAVDVPRWCTRPVSGGQRRTMTNTFLADALDSGAVLRQGVRARRLRIQAGRVTGVELSTPAGREVLAAHAVFVCAGAVNTSALLLASGVRGHVGHTLYAHPMAKIAAVFDEPVSEADDVPSVQILQFAPRITIGSSSSSPAVLGSSLARTQLAPATLIADWSRMPLYYAAVCPTGTGRVHRGGIVTYKLTNDDMRDLAHGLELTARALLAAGARAVVAACAGASLTTDPGLAKDALTRKSADLTTVHLTSTVPMGELAHCPVDSFGRVKGVQGLHVNDSSVLPTAPGVNPQATVMAVAMRCAERFATT